MLIVMFRKNIVDMADLMAFLYCRKLWQILAKKVAKTSDQSLVGLSCTQYYCISTSINKELILRGKV